MENELLGFWLLDPKDEDAHNEYGRISLEFKKDGELIYTVYEKNHLQKALMTYSVHGNKLISNQLSTPKEFETDFKVSGKILELYFDGIKSRYHKEGLLKKLIRLLKN